MNTLRDLFSHYFYKYRYPVSSKNNFDIEIILNGSLYNLTVV